MFALTVSIASLVALSAAFPSAGQSRVVNGQTAVLGQFPYQVLLLVQLPQRMALCGGSLLSNQWVLTAGHCTVGASLFVVTLGAVDFYDSAADECRVVLIATEYYRHEKYNPLFAINDVAVVKLPHPVELNDRVQPVDLPMGRDSYADRKVVVSGWGRQKNGGNVVAEKLQYAPLTVVTNNECSKTFGPLVVKKTTLCAKGNQKESPCSGDSGGPLVLEGSKTQVGVVSFGNLACELGYPSGFARLTSFVDWVKKKTGL